MENPQEYLALTKKRAEILQNCKISAHLKFNQHMVIESQTCFLFSFYRRLP